MFANQKEIFSTLDILPSCLVTDRRVVYKRRISMQLMHLSHHLNIGLTISDDDGKVLHIGSVAPVSGKQVPVQLIKGVSQVGTPKVKSKIIHRLKNVLFCLVCIQIKSATSGKVFHSLLASYDHRIIIHTIECVFFRG